MKIAKIEGVFEQLTCMFTKKKNNINITNVWYKQIYLQSYIFGIYIKRILLKDSHLNVTFWKASVSDDFESFSLDLLQKLEKAKEEKTHTDTEQQSNNKHKYNLLSTVH